MEERAQGKFDKWKEEQFEEFWGQKQKVDPKALAGQSSTVKLHRLIEADLCKVGDLWSYSRIFGKGKARVLVEKEFKVHSRSMAKLVRLANGYCKLTDIDHGILTFAIPPGTVKYARRLKEDAGDAAKENGKVLNVEVPDSPGSESDISSIPSDVEDYIPVSVNSLATLEEKLVELDGKFTGKVNGNAWKSIRVKRHQQDIGSLFDIRENFFVYGSAK